MVKILKIMLPVALIVPALLLAVTPRATRKEDPAVGFPHKLHIADAGLTCDACHDKVAESTSGAEDLLPAKETCLQCHEAEMIDTLACPTDTTRVGEMYPDYSPKFNHKKHLDKKIDCERCHVGISAADSSTTRHLPVMALCMSCHDGMQAPKECITCHATERGILPDDHQSLNLWRKAHGDKARLDNAQSCTLCHQRNDCQECHQGDNLMPRVHPLGFEFSHPLEIRSNRTDCSACHEDRSFCIQCHTERQVYPRSHQNAAWANTTTGGRHAAEASRNIEQCGACHEDEPGSNPVCSNCHGQ